MKFTVEPTPKPGDKDVRICALYCMGELMVTYGSQMMSLVADLVTMSLKFFKSTSHSVLLRYHAAATISKCIQSTAKAIPESTVKDLLKTFRHGMGDKAPAIQRVSADIVTGIQRQLGQLTIQETDNFVQLCLRYMDSADHTTRRHFAEVSGIHLAASVSTPLVNQETTARPERKGAGEDEEENPPESTKSNAPSVTLQSVLSQLSTSFNKSTGSLRTRVGIVQIYTTLLNELGPTYVETNYSVFARHFLVDIIGHPKNQVTLHETLRVRKFVSVILRDLVGVRMLSEQGQIGAIQDLITNYLRRWPALMPGQNAPHRLTLVAALKEVSELLQQLGNAPQFLQNALTTPVVRLLEHPDHAVRIAASYCLQQFCLVVPRRLQLIADDLAAQLTKGVAALLVPGANRDAQDRALGQATGLAGLFSLFPYRHLYISYDVCSKVLEMAMQLLKRAGEHDLTLAAVEVEISWTLISALVTLGRHFVHPHMSQLLTLWRNTFSRSSVKDTEDIQSRFSAEVAFLLHVRHCALGALLQFLTHNSGLLTTLDVARRVGASLSSALSFANSLASDGYDEELDSKSPLPHVKATTSELEVMFKCRMFQCFAAFGTSHINESAQAAVIDSAMTVFSGPDLYRGSQVQAAIAASAGSFVSIWECNDGYAYGISTHDWSANVENHSPYGGREDKSARTQDSVEWGIIQQLQQPVLGSCECEPLCLLTNISAEERSWPEPPPAASRLVDAALDVFAVFLAHQSTLTCDRVWTAVLNNAQSPRLERNPGRKIATTMNVAGALLHILCWADRESRDGFASVALYSHIIDFLKGCLSHPDQKLRKTASEAYGLTASRLDTGALTTQVKGLVDQVLSNRDPNSRAGCAMALGSLYTSVGGLAAGPLLKTIVNVLMSLGNDPHPLVHYYSLQSLSTVIDAASLSYEPHIRSTLGMLAKLYMSDAHEPEGRRHTVSAGLNDVPVYAVICEIEDSMVAVLGPDLRDSTRFRNLLLCLVQEFSVEVDEAVVVEAMRCLQHCLMFARDFLDVPMIVLRLRKYLSSPRTPLKFSAVNGLYLLVQKDVLLVSKYGGDELAEALFAMLDADASVDGVHAILTSWLSQTVTANPSAWIYLCQKIMSQANNSQRALKPEAPSNTAQDDESESLQVPGESNGEKGGDRRAIGRWRTQLFALQCLHNICKTLSAAGLREHVDLRYAKTCGLEMSNLLATKVPELIRMAFTASTAYVTEIRLAGLIVLRDIVEIFADSPDPDVEGSLLLEQYQAPIAAALTPAFSADSTPELLASAVEVCAIFIGSGVVEDGSKMGRILKLLTTALEQCAGASNLTLGEGGQLGPNASVMLRVSIISAWAKLAMSSHQRTYLEAIILPHRPVLAALWVESVIDYTRLKAHSEMTADPEELTGPGMSSLILEKDVTLQYYADAWWYILGAISLFMQQNDQNLLAPLNGARLKGAPVTNGVSHLETSEPCLLYPVLLGLACQVLLDDSSIDAVRLLAEQRVITLQFLSELLSSHYSGTKPMQRGIFGELTAMLYRFALGGPPAILSGVLRVSGALARRCSPSVNVSWELSENAVDCLRVVVCVLRRVASSRALTEPDGMVIDSGGLYNVAVETMRQITEKCDTVVHESVRLIALATLVDRLREESPATSSIGGFLAALKTLLSWPSTAGENAPAWKLRSDQSVHALLSACVINIEAISGRRGPEVTMKLQNNMLAAAVVISIAAQGTTFSYPLVEQYNSLLIQRLGDSDAEIALVARQCANILISSAPTGPPILRVCCRLLLPGLVHLALDAACDIPEERQRLLDSTLKVANPAQIPRLLCVLLPVYVAYLQHDAATKIHKLGENDVLNLASQYPEAFRRTTLLLHPSTRANMETALRQAASSTGRVPLQPKRQIALRQFQT
ncbi:ARM repeat-containing protein [Dacryopinax primogenitus]|uniref:ARM repeat-containing protein n=1 Tax=Dacryopinax primogenitus (strain DJM 731) TaxID=1858805 RepID=M5G7K7_DACPD|nr:ARM repeat-containing protein [Dacryopinax primogenitus]EJU04714.1 ARM repeat-containing protein [Dacryopinax primogenitus]